MCSPVVPAKVNPTILLSCYPAKLRKLNASKIKVATWYPMIFVSVNCDPREVDFHVQAFFCCQSSERPTFDRSSNLSDKDSQYSPPSIR